METRLNSTFANDVTITKTTSVKMSADVPQDEAVNVTYTVNLSGATVQEVLDCRFSVTLRNNKLVKSFADQDELREWAEKMATESNPYRIHFSELGTVMSEDEKWDPETKKQKLIERMKALGITADDLK